MAHREARINVGPIIATAVVLIAIVLAGCAPSAPKRGRAPANASDAAIAAQKTYIAPGDLDEFYLFSSGGHSGQV